MENNDDETTTLSMKRGLKKKLLNAKELGEHYDHFIERLLSEHEQLKQLKKSLDKKVGV